MLTTLTDILRAEKLVAHGEEPSFNVDVASQNHLRLRAYAAEGSFHVRVKRSDEVPDEYERCCAAWRSFPYHAPQALARRLVGDWEILVMAGIPHAPLFAGDIQRNRRGIVQGLVGYFAAAGRLTLPAVGGSHRDYLRSVYRRTADDAAAAAIDRCLSVLDVDSLPLIPQHGDFTVNNLGIQQRRLVVFDWEDFGRVNLPGLDLCTAIASDIALDAHRLREFRDGRYTLLIAQACQAMRLSAELFIELLPVYFSVFLDLKRGYGRPVQQAVRDLVRTLVEGRG